MSEDDAAADVSVLLHYIASQEVRNMGEMLMLAVSELAEGLEEHRDGKNVHYHAISISQNSQVTPESGPALQRVREGAVHAHEMDVLTEWEPDPKDIEVLVKHGIAKPEGLAVELADCIIRCLDTMLSLDVDIDAIVAEKMLYNASRGFKRGKAY